MLVEFECSSCGESYKKEVELNEQLPLFGLCPSCDYLLEKEEDKE